MGGISRVDVGQLRHLLLVGILVGIVRVGRPNRRPPAAAPNAGGRPQLFLVLLEGAAAPLRGSRAEGLGYRLIRGLCETGGFVHQIDFLYLNLLVNQIYFLYLNLLCAINMNTIYYML